MTHCIARFATGVCLAVCVTGGAVQPAEAQTVHTVELIMIDFIPGDVTINLGDTVHWIWVSGGFHNVESGIVVNLSGVHDGNFRSGDFTNVVGTTYDLVFDKTFLDAHPVAGNVYPYYCIVHSAVGMVGTVTVVMLGDVDGDFDVDLTDHAIVAGCLSGPESDLTEGVCSLEEFDLSDTDDDGDVDLRDVAAMQNAFTG